MYAPTSSRLYAVARPRPDELINGEGSGVNCYNALRRRCTSLPAGQDECPIFDLHGLLDKLKGSTSGGGDERKMAVEAYVDRNLMQIPMHASPAGHDPERPCTIKDTTYVITSTIGAGNRRPLVRAEQSHIDSSDTSFLYLLFNPPCSARLSVQQ